MSRLKCLSKLVRNSLFFLSSDLTGLQANLKVEAADLIVSPSSDLNSDQYYIAIHQLKEKEKNYEVKIAVSEDILASIKLYKKNYKLMARNYAANMAV